MSLAALERYNIVKAVTSGPPEMVNEWREAAPGRIMVGAWWTKRAPCLISRDFAPACKRVALMFWAS